MCDRLPDDNRAQLFDASEDNLQNVLQKVYANTTVKGFKRLGIDIRKEMATAAEAGMTPIEAIAEITNKALDGDLSKLGTIFEDAQVQAGMRSLIQYMDEYRRIRSETLGAEGVVDEDFSRRIQTAQGAMDRWNATIQNLNISLGTTLVPLLNGLLDKITPVVTAIGDWAAANPELARTVAIDGIVREIVQQARAEGEQKASDRLAVEIGRLRAEIARRDTQARAYRAPLGYRSRRRAVRRRQP